MLASRTPVCCRRAAGNNVFSMRLGTLALFAFGLLLGGCAGSVHNRASGRSASSTPAPGGGLNAPLPGCSDPAGICAAVHGAGIAPTPIDRRRAQSIQAALAIDRRNDLASEVCDLLCGHHQRVSAAVCHQAGTFVCSVWVTPIREQLRVAIGCTVRGAPPMATIKCTPQPLELLPIAAGKIALPAIASSFASHGYVLSGQSVCDDPWGPPHQIFDRPGLRRSYSCLFKLTRGPQHATATAVLNFNLAAHGGWQMHVLRGPHWRAAGPLPEPPTSARA